MTPDQYCEQRTAASGSSFYYSFRLLPPVQRRAITALYAFCREVDDVVDETREPMLARITLTWWRQEVDALYAGHPQHPVTRALAPHLAPHRLPREELHWIIDGMEMDLVQQRYADFTALEAYCYRVASAVGLLSARIFGYRDPATLCYAERLGLAFQLTNILRDVGEDARRGRIYLPQDDLVRHGIAETDLLSRPHEVFRPWPAFRALMDVQIARAEACYAQALAQLSASDRRAQRAGLAMAAIYRATLARLARQPERALHHRVSLSPLHKFWLAWRSA